MTDRQGILYICATPIGNLEDMTYRAVRILQEADLIAAEDTRHSRKLLNHYGITTPLVSYHEHNKRERGPELIDALAEGQQIAIISDAGMPGIADPGSHLVGLALAAGITVVPVPGANAALSALGWKDCAAAAPAHRVSTAAPRKRDIFIMVEILKFLESRQCPPRSGGRQTGVGA